CATTIAITHNLRSPITHAADYVLINGNRQGQLQGDSMGTKIAQLFVLDLIYTLIVQATEDTATKTKQKPLTSFSNNVLNNTSIGVSNEKLKRYLQCIVSFFQR
ncbi:putative transcriptional regulator, partial [Pasteurella multocida subsp. multocida str. Anand1_cattle]